MITSTYPVLMSHDVAAAAAFYRDLLVDLETTFETDWYVSFRLGTWELAVLDASHDTVPEAFRGRTGGVLVNIEVADVDAEHHRIVVEGAATVARSLRSEEFGQRHFIIEAPDGVLVDVIMPIEPGAAFAEAFA